MELLAKIDPSLLGQRLHTLRMAKGFTQAQLAEPGASVAYVSRIEAGHRRPSPQMLEQLAQRLETTPRNVLLGVSSNDMNETRLTLAYAELALESGESDEAEGQAALVLERLGDRSSLPEAYDRAQYLHARALESRGRLEDAILELEDAVQRMERDLLWIQANIALSRCHRETGDFSRAIDVGEAVLADLKDKGLGACDETVQMVVTTAAAYFERGDVGYAVRLCQQAITSAEELGSPTARASAYWNASMMEAEQGFFDRAIPLAQKALALMGEVQDGRNLARLRSQLGIMLLRTDSPDVVAAEHLLAEANIQFESSSASPIDLARNEVALALALFMSGGLREARALANKAYLGMSGVAPLVAADARVLEGRISAEVGDVIEAQETYREAILMLTSAGADRTAAQLWFELGGLLEDVGDIDASREAYKRAAASAGLRARTQAVAHRAQ